MVEQFSKILMLCIQNSIIVGKISQSYIKKTSISLLFFFLSSMVSYNV